MESKTLSYQDIAKVIDKEFPPADRLKMKRTLIRSGRLVVGTVVYQLTDRKRLTAPAKTGGG